MIVRINQIDIAQGEQFAGWPAEGLWRRIEYRWPPDANAFEILVLEHDEKNQALSDVFRQDQLRHLVPDILLPLKPQGHEIVLRLDGPLLRGELAAAFNYLTDAQGVGRFAVSSLTKLSPEAPALTACLRMQALPANLPGLLADPELGLDRNVRLRAFCLPEAWVGPLLDMECPEDERWPEILAHSLFVLHTVRQMRAVQVHTAALSAADLRARLSASLSTSSASSAAPAHP